jgi:hypothetical protein
MTPGTMHDAQFTVHNAQFTVHKAGHGAQGPKPTRRDAPPGHKRLGDAYLPEVATRRRLSGVLHPVGAQLDRTDELRQPGRGPAGIAQRPVHTDAAVISKVVPAGGHAEQPTAARTRHRSTSQVELY